MSNVPKFHVDIFSNKIERNSLCSIYSDPIDARPKLYRNCFLSTNLTLNECMWTFLKYLCQLGGGECVD